MSSYHRKRDPSRTPEESIDHIESTATASTRPITSRSGKGKRRIFSSKVRTGCVTCKTRHVKCDEAKPYCNRCLKWSGTCDGYGDDRWKLNAMKPLPQSASTFIILPPLIEGSLSTGIRFKDEQTYQYFRVFQHKVVVDLSGGFESAQWNRVVLQTCSFTPIQQLSIATAALGCSKRSSGESESHEEQRCHYQYALCQYGEALNGLQKILVEGNSRDLRQVALIGTLLIFCFENILGESILAVSNLRRALDLIHGGLAGYHTPEYSNMKAESNNSDFTPIQPSYTLVQKLMAPLGSIEMQSALFYTFARQNTPLLEIVSISQTNTLFSPSSYYLDTSPSDECVAPSSFKSLSQARHRFERITSRDVYVGSSDDRPLEYTSSSMISDDTWTPLCEHSSPAITYNSIEDSTTANISTSFPSTMRAEMEQWHAAFFPLFQTVLSCPSNNSSIWTLTQAVHGCSAIILLGGGVEDDEYCTDEEALANYPSQISHMTVLAIIRLLVSHPSFSCSFVCDIGVIPSLWFVVMLSSSFALKHQAIQLLRQMAGRIECVWDAEMVAGSSERILAGQLEKLPAYNHYPDTMSMISNFGMVEWPEGQEKTLSSSERSHSAKISIGRQHSDTSTHDV